MPKASIPTMRLPFSFGVKEISVDSGNDQVQVIGFSGKDN